VGIPWAKVLTIKTLPHPAAGQAKAALLPSHILAHLKVAEANGMFAHRSSLYFRVHGPDNEITVNIKTRFSS